MKQPGAFPSRRRRRYRPIDIPIWALALLGGVAYGLAVIGWLVAPPLPGHDSRGIGEALYLALSVIAPSDTYTAFNLEEAGVLDDPATRRFLIPARYLGAVFFILTVAKVALTWFYGAFLKRAGKWFNRDHVVVVGDTTFADRTAEAAAERGLKVVQFEPGGTETVPDGILTMDSDIGLAEMLSWSSAHRARALVFATADNAENADNAERVFRDAGFEARAREATRRSAAASEARAGPQIFVATDDTWFERRDELGYDFHDVPDNPIAEGKLDCVVEFVGESRAAARAVMTAEPVFRLQSGEIQHILIIGFGSMGQAILAEYCETQRVDPFRMQWVTIVDPDPNAWDRFVKKVPGWADVFDGAYFPTSIDALGGDTERFARRLAAAPPAAIYVTTGGGIDSMAASADAKRVIADMGVSGLLPEARMGCPIFACARSGMNHLGGDAVHMVRGKPGAPMAERLPILKFGSWPEVVNASRVLDDEPDRAAFRIHATHNELFSKTPPRNWSQISETERYSSRSAAAFVPALLHAAGFDLTPWQCGADGQPPSVNRLPRLAPGETLVDSASTLVRLARLEHSRWCAERYLKGFQRGPKDLPRKRHPRLVPFDDLDAGSKSYNIQYVALLQSMLLDGATGPVIARPEDARRPVMRPTDLALVRDAGLDPDAFGAAPKPPPAATDPPPAPNETELAHG